MLDSHDYAQSVNEYNALVGQQPTYTAAQLQKYADGSDPLGYPNTNWWKSVMRTWSYQNNGDVMSPCGAVPEKVKYYLSGQYLRQNSMYKGGSDYYTNKNARANVDIQAAPSFRVGLDAMYRSEYKLNEGPQYGTAGDIFNELWSAYPYLVPQYPNGKVGVGIGGGSQNSMVYILNGDLGSTNTNYNFLQTKTSFNWNLDKITPGLHLDGYYSYDLFYYNYKGFNAQPPPLTAMTRRREHTPKFKSSIPPNLSITNSQTGDQLVNIKLGYERKFGKSTVGSVRGIRGVARNIYRAGCLSHRLPEQ